MLIEKLLLFEDCPEYRISFKNKQTSREGYFVLDTDYYIQTDNNSVKKLDDYCQQIIKVF